MTYFNLNSPFKRRGLSLALAGTLLLVLLFTSFGHARAAVDPALPAQGKLGAVFTLKMGGFLPNERVNLWTTDPKYKAVDTSYILADKNGNLELRVDSTGVVNVTLPVDALDPKGSISTTRDDNYVTYVERTNLLNTINDRYLRVVLLEPAVGTWSMTAQGSTSKLLQVSSFNVL